MRKISLMLLPFVVMLTQVGPAAASGPTGMIGIYSVAGCQDTTTVAVSDTASAATNRIKAWIYKQNDKGEWSELDSTVTDNFNSGDFIGPGARLFWQVRERWNATASSGEIAKPAAATVSSM